MIESREQIVDDKYYVLVWKKRMVKVPHPMIDGYDGKTIKKLWPLILEYDVYEMNDPELNLLQLNL